MEAARLNLLMKKKKNLKAMALPPNLKIFYNTYFELLFKSCCGKQLIVKVPLLSQEMYHKFWLEVSR